MQTNVIACPECAGDIEASPAFTGEIIDCGDCGVELEVTNLSPVTVEVAPEVEEDWGE